MLTLLTQLMNQTFGDLGFKAMLASNLALCIFSIFGCISTYHELNIVVYSFLPCGALLTYIQFYGFSVVTGHFYENSKYFDKSLAQDFVLAQTQNENTITERHLIFLKQLRSCRALRIEIGSHYIMSKNVKIVSLGIIFNYCVYLLLA